MGNIIFAALLCVLLLYPRTAVGEDLRQIRCLALMTYHEARGEGTKGMQAVAYVAINRANSGRYPQDLCKVVRQPYQFTGMKKEKLPIKEKGAWEKAYATAVLSFYGLIKDPVDGALYFHNTTILPSWASAKRRVAQINSHIFYK